MTLLKYWKSDRFMFGDVFGEQYAGNPMLDLCDPVAKPMTKHTVVSVEQKKRKQRRIYPM